MPNNEIRSSRKYFCESIRVEKKTLKMLAEESNVTVLTVKNRIKRCYEKKAWADKLIALALENEKSHDECKETSRTVLLDTSMLLNYPEEVEREVARSQVFVPTFCWHTAQKIAETEKSANPGLAQRHMDALESLYIHVNQVFGRELPYIKEVPTDAKAHSILFIKYLVWLRQQHPDMVALTCSREIREIAELNGIKL